MRITLSQLVIIFTLSSMSYASDTSAQGILDHKVNIAATTTTLNNVLGKLEKSVGVRFIFSRNVIDLEQLVSVSEVQSQKLSEVLDQILKSRGISYRVINQQIVLGKLKAEPEETINIVGTSVQEQKDLVLTGKVTDKKGEALIGVSVKIKNTTIGASTNVNGEFTLKVPDHQANATLEISYIGFVTQQIAIAGKTRINVQLAEDVKTLEEVVVVGYNVVKKSDVTGSVVSVGSEQIRSRPVQNALQAIQGKAAGVDVTSNERPGEVGSIRIRGVRSLNATNSPLYVVDGIPLAAGGIEAINPNDIEAIDILKDASATAIYGSRGANGVVLVTTKKGKSGSMSLNYVGTATIETMEDRMDMMNAAQYIEFRRDAYRRITYLNKVNGTSLIGGYPDGAVTRAADSAIFSQDPYAWRNVLKGWESGTWDPNRVSTTDWTGMVTRTGLTHDHNLSASGGTEKLKAYASFGYLDQVGSQLGQDYKRYSGKVSADVNPVKWFSFGGNINATYGIQNYGFATTNATGAGSLYAAAQGMLPFTVPYDDAGQRINLPGADINIVSPIGEDQYNINLRNNLRTLASLYADVTIFKGLKYRVNFGPDFYNYRNGRWMDKNSINRGGGEAGSTNYAQLNQTQRLAYTLDNLLYFDRSINKDHHFGLTLLHSASSFKEETSTMTATSLPWNSQKWNQLSSVSKLDAYGTGLVDKTLISYMGRFNYDLKNRYILTASARWDGASQLAEGHKWDFFPSAALAWRMEQEDFLKNVSWIDQLKLRVGVGSTGNAAIDPYLTLGGLQTLYYTFGSSIVPGYVSSDASLSTPNPLPNKELGWEHTTQWNLGVDFDVFRGRIGGSLDLYSSKTKDLLMLANIISVNGYTTSFLNAGQTANKGIDLTINSINVKSRDFKWSSTLNFSANRDHIVTLSQGKQDDITNKWFIGERLNVFYDYQKAGIWQDTPEDQEEMAKFNANISSVNSKFRPGSIKVIDQNNDYKIDANNDMVIVGHAMPNWTAGLTNTFNYKNFDLSFFIFSRWGYKIATGAESLQGRFAQRNVNYWTPSNSTNDYPAPYYSSAAGDPYKSSMNYQDASFIKIRNVSLGYLLPKSAVSKLHLSSVRMYAQAMNPGLLYSKIDWIDPDLGGSTFNRGFVFGLNVGF